MSIIEESYDYYPISLKFKDTKLEEEYKITKREEVYHTCFIFLIAGIVPGWIIFIGF